MIKTTTTKKQKKVGKYVMNEHHLRIYQRCASCTHSVTDDDRHKCKLKSIFARSGNSLGNCPQWEMREQLASLGAEQGTTKTPQYIAFVKGWRRAEARMTEKLRKADYDDIESAYNESCGHCKSDELRNIYYQAWSLAEESQENIESVAKPMRALMRANIYKLRDAYIKSIGKAMFLER